jgi:hypothetical protein
MIAQTEISSVTQRVLAGETKEEKRTPVALASNKQACSALLTSSARKEMLMEDGGEKEVNDALPR